MVNGEKEKDKSKDQKIAEPGGSSPSDQAVTGNNQVKSKQRLVGIEPGIVKGHRAESIKQRYGHRNLCAETDLAEDKK